MSEQEPAAAPGRRRPGRVRRWVVRPFVWGLLLLVAALAAGLLLLQSRFAREQALARMVRLSSNFLGRPIHIGSVDYSVYPPALEVRDVVVPGPRPGDPPVLRAPYARVGLTIKDLRGRVFDLDQIEVERPEVYLQLNPDGSSNLPQFNFGKGGGQKRFDVRIGHILVQDGTFRLNERRTTLSLEARAVWGRLTGRGDRGGEGGNRLDALVTAQDVTTTLPHANAYRATVSARGSIVPERGRVEIAVARLAGPDLKARVKGFVDYRSESRRVELHFTGDGAAQLAGRLGYMTDPIAGPVTVAGRFDWRPAGWSYSGTARSPRIATFGRTFQGIEAAFTGGPDRIDVQLGRAGYAGGEVSGVVGVEYGKETREGIPVAVDLDYAGLLLQTVIADQFPGQELPIVGGLVGRARGTLQYRFGHRAFIAGTGRADVHVQGESRNGGLPIAGDLPITLDRGVVAGRDIHLTSPGQEITSRGFRYDIPRARGELDFRVASRDVGPLAPLLRGRPVPGEPPPFWLPTQGRGTAEGTVTFARDTYDLRLLLDLQDVVAPVTAADTAHGSLTLGPRAVDDLRLELSRGGGAVIVTGRIPLAPPGRTTASEPLALAVDAVQWPAAGLGWILGPKLAGLFDGQLSGRVDLSGPADRLTGRIDAQARDLVVEGVPLGRARAVASFDGGRIQVQEGEVEMPAGIAGLRGSYDPDTRAFDVTLTAPGLSLSAPPLSTYLAGQLTGRVSIDAAASGTLDQPQAMVAVRGRDLALNGRAVGQQGGAQVVATWNGQHLDVQGSLLGLASFQGGGRLDRRGADLAVDVHTESLGLLARAFSPAPLPDFAGSLVGTAGFGADFAAGTYRGAVRLSDLRLQYQGRTIANREPVVAEITPERATIQSFYMGEPGTENELFVNGEVGLRAGAPLNLRFQSTVSATWAELLLPGTKVQGALDLLGTVRGTAGAPLLNGEGEIRDAQLIVPNLPQAFEDVRGFLSFNRDRVVLDELHARLGGGTLDASGSFTLPGPGRELAYRFNALAKDISLRFPEFLLNRGDAEVSLISNGAGGGRQIVGAIDLNRSLYVEDVTVDPLQLLQRALLQRQRLEAAETDTFQATTQLALSVRGPGALRVRNNLANLQGDVNLNIRGSLARPVVFGDVELDPGGTLVFNDNRYEVVRGELTFANPNQIDPIIDLVAQSEIQGFNITLNLGGTFEKPDVHFASDTNLADLEIVSLVATGQRPSPEAGYQPLPSPDEQVAPTEVARQFLYGQAASALSKRVGTLFGFDRFRIDPLTEAGQPIAGVGFTVGKRLSRDVFVTYSYDPTNNRQSVVQVEWQIQKNVTLVLTQVGDGTYAVDAQWERRF